MSDRDHFRRDTARDAALVAFGARVLAKEQAKEQAKLRAGEEQQRARAEYDAKRPGPRPEPLTYGPPPPKPRPGRALVRSFFATLALSPVFAAIWVVALVMEDSTHPSHVWWPFFLGWLVALISFWLRAWMKAKKKWIAYERASAAYADRIKRQMAMPIPRSTAWKRVTFFFYRRDGDVWLCRGQDGPAITFSDEAAAHHYWTNLIARDGPPTDEQWELCWHVAGENVSHSRGPLNEKATPPAQPTAGRALALPAGGTDNALHYVFIDSAGNIQGRNGSGPLLFPTKAALWAAWQTLRVEHPEFAGGHYYVSAIDSKENLVGKRVPLY